MNPETFAEWLKRQGYKVYHTKSSYWYNAGPGVYQAFPYHWQIDPEKEELLELVRQSRAIAVRFSKPYSCKLGKISYHVVAQPPYDFNTFKSHGKNGIRKGLSQCRIEQVSFSRLADEGWSLQQDTLDRQNRSKSMRRDQWEKICLSAEGLPGFEAWAAIVGESLAATVITARIDDIWTIPYAQSLREYLGMHVNNALFYSVCSNFLSRPGIQEVFTNLHSLDAPESVDEFKFRMGLIPKAVRQQIYFNPLFRPFIGSGTYRLVKLIQKSNPDNPFWAKTEGIFRFYLEGKLPPEKQCLPENLVNDLLFDS